MQEMYALMDVIHTLVLECFNYYNAGNNIGWHGTQGVTTVQTETTFVGCHVVLVMAVGSNPIGSYLTGSGEGVIYAVK